MGKETTTGRPKGTPKTGGRKKGTPNKVTAEIREFSKSVTLGSVEWVAGALQRMNDGKAPHLETYFLQMGFGKPREGMDLTTRTIETSVELTQAIRTLSPETAEQVRRAIHDAARGKAD